MDLHTITGIVRPTAREDLSRLGPGDAVLAGGTLLFAEPHTHLRRLVDLNALGWTPITVHPDGPDAGIEIAATCTIAELGGTNLPVEWLARPLIRQCCEAFLASFKIHRFGTIPPADDHRTGPAQRGQRDLPEGGARPERRGRQKDRT